VVCRGARRRATRAAATDPARAGWTRNAPKAARCGGVRAPRMSGFAAAPVTCQWEVAGYPVCASNIPPGAWARQATPAAWWTKWTVTRGASPGARCSFCHAACRLLGRLFAAARARDQHAPRHRVDIRRRRRHGRLPRDHRPDGPAIASGIERERHVPGLAMGPHTVDLTGSRRTASSMAVHRSSSRSPLRRSVATDLHVSCSAVGGFG
jgi:hypothetical protein